MAKIFTADEVAAQLNETNPWKGTTTNNVPGWPGETGVYGDYFAQGSEIWLAIEVPATETAGAIKTAVSLGTWGE